MSSHHKIISDKKGHWGLRIETNKWWVKTAYSLSIEKYMHDDDDDDDDDDNDDDDDGVIKFPACAM